MKKILCVLNYYYPYVSGVSEYARLLCEKLAEMGHDVTVLTSNHDKLPETEVINGVKVIRTKVILKISKGTISPTFITKARKLAKEADVVNLHLPMLESSIISLLMDKKKIVTTYQCDINLPAGFINNMIVKIMDMSNNICLKRSRRICVITIDYMKHSRIAAKYVSKMTEVGAPIKKYNRCEVQKEDGKIIGFCGRIVEEKGIDVLLKAFEIIKKKTPEAKLYIGGDYKNVAGGSVYPDLMKYIKENNITDVTFLGKIKEEDMEKFYSGLDVFVLPSVNSLEAFGMVQVEAMMCGTPVVASDLYGVRTIVQNTGMGEIAKRSDASDLAEKILKVLNNKETYVKDQKYICDMYGTEACVDKYLKVF